MSKTNKLGYVKVKSLSIKPKLPRYLLWEDKETEKDFLNDPFEKKILILLKEASEKNTSLFFPHLVILNEAFYQCTRIVYENESVPNIEALELDIKANLGLHYFSKWVFKMMYAILASRKNNSKEVIHYMESFDVFNFMMNDSRVYLNYIKKVKNNRNKQFVDLSPRPCAVSELKFQSIFWEEVTCNFNDSTIRAVLNLWSDPLDKLDVLDLIEKDRKDNGYLVKTHFTGKTQEDVDIDILKIRLEINNEFFSGCVAEPLSEPAEDIKEETDYAEEITRLQGQNQTLQTKVEQLNSELNRLKDKEDQERSFTLSMILDYSLNHTNKDFGLAIINMLNRFFRDLGNSTDDERRMVDEIENKILHPYSCVGNTFNNANVTMYDSRFEGAMYDVRDNDNVTIGGVANGKE